MALDSEYLKIYENLILKKLGNGEYEFIPTDKEDAEYFNYHFIKELGKNLKRRSSLQHEYRAGRPTDMRRRQVYSPIRNKLRFLRQERLEDNVYIPPEAPIIDIIQVDTYLIGKYHFVVVLLRIAYTGKQLFLVSIL